MRTIVGLFSKNFTKILSLAKNRRLTVKTKAASTSPHRVHHTLLRYRISTDQIHSGRYRLLLLAKRYFQSDIFVRLLVVRAHSDFNLLGLKQND